MNFEPRETHWTPLSLHYDFTGADFHMLESEEPRAGSACPPTAADDCDPINGREWTTDKEDLQFACVFPLATPLDCTAPANNGACACEPESPSAGAPLCQMTTQVRGRAYPTIRALALARALDAQAVVSSVCPIHTTEETPGDPLYAYRPAFTALVDRVGTALTK